MKFINDYKENRLIKILQENNDFFKRQEAVQSLENFDGDKVISALINALKDEYSKVRELAAGILGKKKAKSAFNDLLTLLNDKHENVRLAAINSLLILNFKESILKAVDMIDNFDKNRDRYFQCLAEHIKTNNSSPLQDIILKSSNFERVKILDFLYLVPDARLSDSLLKLSKDDDNLIHKKATIALASIAIHCSIEMDKNNIIKELLKLLDDSDIKFRSDVIATLGMLEADEAVIPLTSMLNNTKDLALKKTVITALGKIGNSHSISALIQITMENQKDLYEHSLQTLTKIGQPALKIMIETAIKTIQQHRTNLLDKSTRLIDAIISLAELDKENHLIDLIVLLLENLFANPSCVRIYRSVHLAQRNPEFSKETIKFKTMLNKFIPYTQLTEKIINLTIMSSTYTETENPLDDVDYATTIFTCDNSNEAITELCQMDSNAITNILHHISKKADIKQISFQNQRNSVIKELQKRGNIEYSKTFFQIN